MDNLELFFECLKHPEPFIEKSYSKEKIIITDNKSVLNSLMKANNEIIEKITAYKVAMEFGDSPMMEGIISRIIELLEIEGINNAEFSNYWGVHDISFSIYEKLTLPEKRYFLKNMIEAYLEARHALYQTHGYSATTIQVRSDSVAHKRSGELGSHKTQAIFNTYGYSNISYSNTEQFMKKNIGYALADKEGSRLFDSLIHEGVLKFEWGKHHQGKRPDFIFKNDGHIFVMEHKHMKEGGGGQNKQIVEVIDFIKQNENNIRYITFLDGIFFNSFINKRDPKLEDQLKQITCALKENKNNYFVNTYGFEYILKNPKSLRFQ